MALVAVITDAVSAGHYFPNWYRYYGALFGYENLYVVAYDGSAAAFRSFSLGSVFDVEAPYGNLARVANTENLVRILLKKYDRVIRCDIDEFLVAHPDRHRSLAEYLDGLKSDHVTAVGLNVVEDQGDPALDTASPLLKQRSWCFRESAYSKTCIVSAPLRWSPGFHNASVRPHFQDLFLFHMKFADFASRSRWLDRMISSCAETDLEHRLFRQAAADLETEKQKIWRLPRWDADRFESLAFEERMQAAILEPLPGEHCFRQVWFSEAALIPIPEPFRVFF